jgi:hypothetical protein
MPDLAPPAATAKALEEYKVYQQEQRAVLMSKSVLTAALRKSEVAALPSVQAETESGDAAKWLHGIVKVEFPGKAEIMTVSCTMRDPHEAAVLTNAVVDAYMAPIEEVDRKLQDQFKDVDSRASKLERELDEKLQALLRIEAASLAGKAETPPATASQDAVALRTAADSIKRALRPLTADRERIGVEIKVHSRRIIVVERAQEPAAASQPSF